MLFHGGLWRHQNPYQRCEEDFRTHYAGLRKVIRSERGIGHSCDDRFFGRVFSYASSGLTTTFRLLRMSRTKKWSVGKTVSITAICGLGHVLGSVVIGSIGLMLGTMLMQIEALEAFRGEAAAWLLIGFGLAYLTWGIVTAVRDIPHTHLHSHVDGTVHSHLHKHDLEHRHVHQARRRCGKERATAKFDYALVVILDFCVWALRSLIPLLMYPAAEANGLPLSRSCWRFRWRPRHDARVRHVAWCLD